MPTAKPKLTPPPPEALPPLETGTSVTVPDRELTSILTRTELETLRDMALDKPRVLTKFLAEATAMVTISEKVATACVYAIPFRDGSGGTQMVRGASARFAEILQSCYTNSRVGGFLLQETETDVIARGYFTDLEKNNTRASDVPRRIVGKHGQRYSRDVIGRTAAAAISIAKRNAVLESIPQAIWQPIYDAALEKIAGTTETLAKRRQDALMFLARQGASEQMVLNVLGVASVKDIGLDELTVLRGLATAIRDGEVTVEEAFNPARGSPSVGVAGAKDALSRSLKPGDPGDGPPTREG